MEKIQHFHIEHIYLLPGLKRILREERSIREIIVAVTTVTKFESVFESVDNILCIFRVDTVFQNAIC